MSGLKTQKMKDRSLRLKELLPKLAKGRYYITDEKFQSFHNERQISADKPNGLWYSVGNEWFDFILNAATSLGVKRYVYQIKIDTKFVLKLNGASAIDKFTEEYVWDGEKESPFLSMLNYISWEKVAKKYGAIEIAPYCWKRQLTMHTHWYYGWDVASGCIWDGGVVKKVTLVEDLDEVH